MLGLDSQLQNVIFFDFSQIIRNLLSQNEGTGSNSLEIIAKAGARWLAHERVLIKGPLRDIETRVYNPCPRESLGHQWLEELTGDVLG